MVARAFRCDESRLRSFLDDNLPELEHAEVTDHLDTCAGCRRTLERLAAGSRLLAELPQLAPSADETPTRWDSRPNVGPRPSTTIPSTFSDSRMPRDRWAGWDRTR